MFSFTETVSNPSLKTPSNSCLSPWESCTRKDMHLMSLFTVLLLLITSRLASTDLVPFDDWLYQRVALPDVNIYFRYAGTGPPILLVHGFPEHSVIDLETPLSDCDSQEFS